MPLALLFPLKTKQKSPLKSLTYTVTAEMSL